MKADEIYHETIPFPLMRVLVITETLFAAAFLSLFIYQVTAGPIGDSPAPDWFYLLMMAIFVGVIALLTNFTRLTVSITPDAITLAYGRIKYSIPWQRIEGCRQDKNPGITYGGWGIRMAKVGGKWVLVYNVIKVPAIVLELKEGRFSQFVFSTKRPEEVMNIIQQQIG